MSSSNENTGMGNPSGTTLDAGQPRICMATSRRFRRQAFRCGPYEGQDVLSGVANVDLLYLEPGPGFSFKEKWLKRLLYHDVTRKMSSLNPGLREIRLTKDYDLFIATCQFHWDFPYINAIRNWKDRCKTSVLWIDELYAGTIPQYKYWLGALKRFDHIFIGSRTAVVPLSKAINRECHWGPGAVDVLRFTPYPNPPQRVIDVYSIGRRWEGIHQALLQAGARKELFYIYDSFPGADTEPFDYLQHRDLFANIAKRSRYFMVAPGKIDDVEAKGQVELGYRYYEGAATGAVMIGQLPDNVQAREMFPWPDAVVPIQPDGSDVLEVLTKLGREPERFLAMSRRNAAEALLRHDWLYRWKEIFRVAGFEPTPGMVARERRLKDLAEIAASANDINAIARGWL
jgi:hypothetical protein